MSFDRNATKKRGDRYVSEMGIRTVMVTGDNPVTAAAIVHAAGAYQLRRRREALIERDRALRTFVVDRLAEGWTPEQISGWLKEETNVVCRP